MDAQFENLCRICAANTKKKDDSVVESVFIFKTVGLKDKISRHLYLNVAEDDLLPKVLCKSCYRQVEATASLSNIAKHTQLAFRDFLLSTVPKNVRESTSSQVNVEESQGDCTTNTENRRSNAEYDEYRSISLSRDSEAGVNLTATQKHDKVLSHKEHHSVTAHQVGQGSSSKTDNVKHPARRGSVFVDTRYGSTPMSIAQRSMQQHPSSLAQLHPEVTFSKAPKASPEKKHSPAGVINFIQTHGRITGSAAPCISSGNQAEGVQTLRHERNLPSTSGNLSNLSNNLLQQKRRNLKNALNNIKAKHSGHGQVSLLKSSQPNSNIQPLVTTTVVPHQSLYGCEPSVEEALPEHIIIAAPKKKKEETDKSQVHRTTQKPKIEITPKQSSAPVSVTVDVSPPTTKTSPNVHSLTDAISLGNVIRDPDLLKLILKALKWPVSSGNCEEQMTRLKSSKFAVIMSDRNLLQDTDLTQLLGPYLGPMLAVAQQQQQQKQSSATAVATASPPKTIAKDTISVSDLSCTMPYKLPPETSLQLVPSSPPERELPPQQPLLTKPTTKRTQRKPRNRENFARSSEEYGSNTLNATRVAKELQNINAMLLSQFGSSPADVLNEALVSMLKQQQQETTKIQSNTSRRRSASTTSTGPINLEDIVLVEPQPALDVLESLTVQGMQSSDNVLVEQEPISVPSRPIIKRRKTVTQTSKQVKTNALQKDCLPTTCQIQSRNEPLTTESLRSIETPDMTEENSQSLHSQVEEQRLDISQAPTSTVLEGSSSQSEQERDGTDGETMATSGNGETKGSRKSDVKAALGQKLLEAIGLPQQGKDVPPEASRDSLRSALKRSLKQAQEQQQQLKRVKQEEPVKQMADSTTKPSLIESAAEEHKKAIAERELALLKRKSKVPEPNKISVKDEKTERADVSSSSSRNRRNRKTKGDTNEEDSGAEDKKPSERWDEDDDLPLKADGEKLNRPTRTSKTMSKYYKGPAMTTRSTRQR
ncbi:LOW QUALITY PROTEIN: myb-like protein K [Drosophila tropicalis]|uniref:LOW QUALITY PROTEIN: myb-like protein K n=1 Tax=Drosophila tropicalis TaxID=46794 RepID=UPI0035ABE3C1